MKRWWHALRVPARPARPQLERLEDRLVPTVTYHGGVLLPHVEVQALYYGSDWVQSSYYPQTGQLEGFLQSVVGGTYMDMLTTAGYGVGRGTHTPGQIDLANVNKRAYLDDSTIQAVLQRDISNGTLAAPDSNRLYVVYVEDNVVVSMGGGNSINDFIGYHGAFAGHSAGGAAADIRYAVVTYPGGRVGNGGVDGLSTLDSTTVVTSHELAEAVTDPDANYKQTGWYDDLNNGEVGDIAEGLSVRLGGWMVQREASQLDLAMTPAGAAADRPVSFALLSNGDLYEHSAAGWQFIASGIVSVSEQGIDDIALAFVDVIDVHGNAYEYHDDGYWAFLTSGVVSAQAGQDASYVLLSNGSVYEFDGNSGSWTYLAGSVAAISAGTDSYGVNMVDVLYSWGGGWEHSDASGWHVFAYYGVQSVSAGQQGNSEVLFAGGYAYHYGEATGALTYQAAGVARVSIGTDLNGNPVVDLVFGDATGLEWRAGAGWASLGGNIQETSKARAGVVDVLFYGGTAYEHTATGYTYLDVAVKTAV
jgi:hypothetical protein